MDGKAEEPSKRERASQSADKIPTSCVPAFLIKYVDHAEHTYRRMLLRSGGDQGARRTVGDGLLSLRKLPPLFSCAGKRVHVMEMGGCEPHQRRGVPGKIQEQRHQRSSLLHEMRQPHLGRSSDARFDRCSHRRSPEFSVQTKGASQLRRNRAADERWFTETQGLPGRDRRVG